MIKKGDLKKGVIYLYDGSDGADGANILFSPKENGSFDYQGCIVLHWSENRVDIGKEPNGYRINEHHLKNLTIASERATKYYYECAESGKDIGTYSWHDSNDDKRK
jgi:hypothetical protein